MLRALRGPVGGLVVLILGMVVVGIALHPLTEEPAADPISRAARDEAACATNWEHLNRDHPVMPDPVLVARDGERWVKVFAEPEWMSVCAHPHSGETSLFGTRRAPARKGKITFDGLPEAPLKGSVLMGTVPAGTSAVSATLADGQVVSGSTDGTYFVVFAPGHDLTGAVVRASGSKGVIDTEAVPAV